MLRMNQAYVVRDKVLIVTPVFRQCNRRISWFNSGALKCQNFGISARASG
jgi:hypothetical protein